jgi:hypothetical protein
VRIDVGDNEDLPLLLCRLRPSDRGGGCTPAIAFRYLILVFLTPNDQLLIIQARGLKVTHEEFVVPFEQHR